MKTYTRVRFVLATLVMLAACKTPPKPLTSGVDLAGMDKSVNPGDDFFEYTNGNWLKATPIPPDKSRYGVSTKLSDEVRTRTQTLIQAAASATSGATGESRKIGDF